MSTSKPRRRLTAEEYLALERPSLERHVFVDGMIEELSGFSPAHGMISTNVPCLIGQQLKGTPFRAFIKLMKVFSGPAIDPGSYVGMFTYPDAVVIRDEPEVYDEEQDVILNPFAVFEVLSPATEAFDRGVKFIRYRRWHPTLSDYVLISQHEPLVEHYQRQADNSWVYRAFEGLEACFVIPSIECTLKLADVYERVQFNQKPSTKPIRRRPRRR